MSDVTVDVCLTSASRETMGAASRAWHHVAWGAIKAGTLRSIVLCCGSKRTSRKSSEKRLGEFELRKVIPPLLPTRTTIVRTHSALRNAKATASDKPPERKCSSSDNFSPGERLLV